MRTFRVVGDVIGIVARRARCVVLVFVLVVARHAVRQRLRHVITPSTDRELHTYLEQIAKHVDSRCTHAPLCERAIAINIESNNGMQQQER